MLGNESLLTVKKQQTLFSLFILCMCVFVYVLSAPTCLRENTHPLVLLLPVPINEEKKGHCQLLTVTKLLNFLCINISMLDSSQYF